MVLAASGVAMTVFTARQLQVDERGALVLATLAGAIVGLLPKSVSAAIAYQLALVTRSRSSSPRTRRALVRDSWVVAGFLTLVAVPAALAAGLLSVGLGWGSLGIVIVGASLAAYLLSAVPLGLSLADARMGRWAVAFAGSQVGALVGTVAVILLWTDDLGPVSLGWAVGSIVGALACNDRESLGALLRGDRGHTRRRQATFSLRSCGASLLTTASGRADIVLLGMLEGARSVGVYSVAVGASELVWFLGHAPATADYGRIGELDEPAARRATWRLSANATILSAAQAIPLVIIAHAAMAFVFGDAFRVSGDYLIVLLIGSVVGASLFPLTNYFTNQLGRPGVALRLAVVMLVVTAVACLICIPLLGTIGAAVGSSVGYAAGLLYAVVAMQRVPRGAPS